jgi:hypothetical protein
MNKLKNIQLPDSLKDNRFLNDLYRDLRERHLLPVVIVLVVGIAAVPLLLRSQTEASAPPPPVAPTGEESSAAVPAVFAENPGVRNYRKRLEALQNKNPFEAKFSLPTPESSTVEDVSGGSTSVTGGDTDVPVDTGSVPPIDTGSSTVPTEPSSPDSSTPSVDVEVSEDDSTTVEDSGGDGGDGTQPPIDHWFLYEHRIDVVVGRVGEAKPQGDVKPLSLLPGTASPVLIYFGSNVQADKAIFAVSRDVTASSGEGTCLPSAKMCEFLELGIGEQRTLEYAPAGPGGGTFVIRLKDIRREVVDEINGDPFEGKSTKSAEAPSEISAWLGLDG